VASGDDALDIEVDTVSDAHELGPDGFLGSPMSADWEGP